VSAQAIGSERVCVARREVGRGVAATNTVVKAGASCLPLAAGPGIHGDEELLPGRV
jgi:hypothetical protein